MNPPFFGTKICNTVTFDDLEPVIDKEVLFAGRWQFRQGADSASWKNLKREKIFSIYERIVSLCKNESVVQPRIVYGYFRCRQDGNGLIVEGEHKSFRFDFPREKEEPHRCVADFFPENFIAMQLVTVGNKATEVATRLFKKNSYQDMFLLKGLAAEATEALANISHRTILKELGLDNNVGTRFSPGYPCFPSLFDQKKIAALLKPKQVGVALTQTCQLIPEYSTSAIISADPDSILFHP